MEQVFAVVVRNGKMNYDVQDKNVFKAVLLDAALNPDADERFLRHLLTELLGCVFDPELLNRDVYGDLLAELPSFDVMRPILVEVNTIHRDDPLSPYLSAYALFRLPVPVGFESAQWTEAMCADPSVYEAFRFYWTFPMAPMKQGYFTMTQLENEFAFPLLDGKIQFMPVEY
jgi:hypothetical protein